MSSTNRICVVYGNKSRSQYWKEIYLLLRVVSGQTIVECCSSCCCYSLIELLLSFVSHKFVSLDIAVLRQESCQSFLVPTELIPT